MDQKLSPFDRNDTDACILYALLCAEEEEFTSGNDLAKHLGISRVGVWNRLENLREGGFEFNAIRNKGYQLSKEPSHVHAALLRAYLALLGKSLPLHFYPQLDSTNSEAERLIANGAPTPFAVTTLSQSKGRGRMGRIWESRHPENLYLSLAFRPNLPLQRLRLFTLWTGLRLCKLLQTKGAEVRLKWPNDLLIEGRKLGGMLTEARVDTDIMRDLTFGIGLNLAGRSASFPEGLRAHAISLLDAGITDFSVNEVVAEIIAVILEAYEECQSPDIAERLAEEWGNHDALAGQVVTGRLGKQKITGVARGIDADGALILEGSEGEQQLLLSGDATLKDC